MKRLSPGKFFGEQVRFRSFQGFRVVESKYPARLALAKHGHAEHNAFTVIDGTVLENGKYLSRPNSFVFQSPEFEHESEFGDCQTRILNISFEENWIGSRFGNVRLLPVIQQLSDAVTNGLVSRLVFEFQINDIASALSIESIVLELLSLMSCRRKKASSNCQSQWLRQVREMVHDQDVAALTVGGVAKEIGIHPSHLTRTFRKVYGETVGEYFRRIRLQKAAELLTKTSLSICSIAQNCGFSDQSHLTRMFRRQFGMTPARYRQICA